MTCGVNLADFEFLGMSISLFGAYWLSSLNISLLNQGIATKVKRNIRYTYGRTTEQITA